MSRLAPSLINFRLDTKKQRMYACQRTSFFPLRKLDNNHEENPRTRNDNLEIKMKYAIG